MIARRLGLASIGVALLVGCAAPQRSNPYDQKACDPACGDGQICRSGSCKPDPCPLKGMVHVENRSQSGTDAFCLSRFEASKHPQTGRVEWTGQAEPLRGVYGEEAQDLCRSRGAELCSQEQWSDACGGWVNENKRSNTPNVEACNFSGKPNDTGANPECEGGYTGLFDMFGNVAEWVTTKENVTDDHVRLNGLAGGSYHGPASSDCWGVVVAPSYSPNVSNEAGFRCCVPCPGGVCAAKASWFQYPIRGTPSDQQGHLKNGPVRMWGTSDKDIWMVSGQQEVAHFDGHIWKIDPVSANPGNAMAIWGRSKTEVYLAMGTTIHKYDGTTWNDFKDLALFDAGLTQVHGLWGGPGGVLWVVGEKTAGGALYKFSGDAWSTPPGAPPVDKLHDVWVASDGQVWFAGIAGQLFHYDGATWPKDARTLSNDVVIFDLDGSAPDNVWAVGERQSGASGVVYRFDGTGTWKDVTPSEVQSAGRQPQGVFAASPDDVWVVGNIALHLTANGSWTRELSSAEGHSAVWAATPTDVWIGPYRKK